VVKAAARGLADHGPAGVGVEADTGDYGLGINNILRAGLVAHFLPGEGVDAGGERGRDNCGGRDRRRAGAPAGAGVDAKLRFERGRNVLAALDLLHNGADSGGHGFVDAVFVFGGGGDSKLRGIDAAQRAGKLGLPVLESGEVIAGQAEGQFVGRRYGDKVCEPLLQFQVFFRQVV